jgi:pantetheine-phosphate adenylyltransferase
VFKFKKLALGGTFDILHKGHEETILRAFKLSEKVLFGLSSDSLAKSIKKYKVNPYKFRKKVLEKFLLERNLMHRAKIIKINDRFGVAHKIKDLDAIMVSEETLPIANKINEIRELKGFKKLEIVLIRKVKAEDGRPISSERIRLGEIDREGKVMKQGEI